MGDTVRLTVGQALVRFLTHQWTERDGRRQRLFAGCFGIFGHGNVAGLGQALLQSRLSGGHDEPELPYYLARNEQAMVHAAVGFARTENRLRTFACTASVGPGSTNMVTGAALASIDRIPVLLLPSDVFASRTPDPVLQQIEVPHDATMTVNDAFRPVSRYFDRIMRPEQLLASAPAAMRVLADPADTGAVTLCLPQDVQAEAFDWPSEFFGDRVWHVARPVPEPAALDRAVATIGASRHPLVVAGGGVVYSDAGEDLRTFASVTGIPVADTHAGKGAINWDHDMAVGGIGATGTAAANALAAGADVVIGIGTRYTDFTTASHTVFANPDVRFVNINVHAFDAAKHAAEMVVADAREALSSLTAALAGHRTAAEYRTRVADLRADWARVTDAAYHAGHGPLPAQTEIFGVLNELMSDDDILVNAAGSMPGDLQALWRARKPTQYHLEYGYSCMGYEIPAALGAKLAAPDREVVAVVGDGTFLLMPSEIATSVAEGVKLVVVVLDNGGFASIGALSESVGSVRFGTSYTERADLGAIAGGLGADVRTAGSVDEFRAAFAEAVANTRTTVVVVRTDLTGPNPPSSAWWDVPVAEVATLDSTVTARAAYEDGRRAQRPYL